MYQHVNFYDFVQAFRDYKRADQFSIAGLRGLFDYLEQYEADTGEIVELDVIAICCDFTEYENAIEAAQEYRWKSDNEDNIDIEDEALEWLEDRTIVIELDNGGIVIQDF